MSYPHFANFIVARPWLRKLVSPIAAKYCQNAGWRQLGLKVDDLLPEENETTMLALQRLDAKASYDRVYRIRRAMQLSLQHKILPKEQWTKDEDDVGYLMPIIEEIERENRERADLDSLTLNKKN